MDRDAFDEAAFAAATGADAATIEALSRFYQVLFTWNDRMNLVGPSARETFWLRHAYDSAQLLTHAPQARVWADLGAGAGFPGIVLAIFLRDVEGAQVHLVESMAKRCAFLREVVTELNLPATVHHGRAEDARILGVEVVTARACAPLDRLLGFAWPLLGGRSNSTTGLFLKGMNVEQELTQAQTIWDFKSEILPSLSDPSGRILRIERLRRASPRT